MRKSIDETQKTTISMVWQLWPLNITSQYHWKPQKVLTSKSIQKDLNTIQKRIPLKGFKFHLMKISPNLLFFSILKLQLYNQNFWHANCSSYCFKLIPTIGTVYTVELTSILMCLLPPKQSLRSKNLSASGPLSGKGEGRGTESLLSHSGVLAALDS